MKGVIIGLVFAILVTCVASQSLDLLIYDGEKGSLVNGFQDWSWAQVNLVSREIQPPGGDYYSLSMLVSNWSTFYRHSFVAYTAASFDGLYFKVNGGENGSQPINVVLISGQNQVGVAVLINKAFGSPIPANKWIEVYIPFASFGVNDTVLLNGFWFHTQSGNNFGNIYFNDITYIGAQPQAPDNVTIVLGGSKFTPPRYINDFIFGVSWANSTQLNNNLYSFNRWGGNAVTRYAWDLDVNNHASDWFFENIPNDVAEVNKLPYGSSSDAFINETLLNQALPMITLPTIGFSPFDRTYRWGFSVQKYGPQQKTDQWHPDAGNGVKPDGSDIVGNDYRDTSKIIEPQYVLSWIDHINEAFGPEIVLYYQLDNEPMLWSSTHRDVHPKPVTYDELWKTVVDYALPIKQKFPYVKIFGPVVWGWCAYFYSAADGCQPGPDQAAHNDTALLEWYIQQIAQYKAQTGIQLVDYIDIHYYPQENNVISDIEDTATVALRFRSIRALWDPTYVDESWIQQPIYILPRIQGWINKYSLPSLGLAVTEYTWGDDDIITGALAEVIVLSIFAQEGVSFAARWVAPDLGTVTELAFDLYTNYDTFGSSVDGQVLTATSSNTVQVESFLYGVENGEEFYLILVNKLDNVVGATIVSSNIAVKQATVILYSFSASDRQLTQSGKAYLFNSEFQLDLEPYSAVLAVIHKVA